MNRNTQRLTILAQDPSIRADGELLFAQVDVPFETLGLGPTGYRLKVVDFDATTNKLYRPHQYQYDAQGQVIDPFALPKGKLSERERDAYESRTLGNPNFHAQQVYVIAMRTLARFERALGRHVRWGFNGHQLHIAPHAFCEANAFYSKPDRALMFGYFPGSSGYPVFTCLSHDIVAHETTHAILDGVRNRFMAQSGPDQAAFHEGFADVVAMLSMFSIRPVVEFALTQGRQGIRQSGTVRTVAGSRLSEKAITGSILLGLGKELGRELSPIRANALRRSAQLQPDRHYLDSMIEPHDRGEVLAAALLRSFIKMWVSRISKLGTFGDDRYSLDMVVDEGVKAADHLLTIAIRALDYCPPLDIEFGDYLAALLTGDREVVPEDERYNYRDIIQATCNAFGIDVPPEDTDQSKCWKSFAQNEEISYHRTHFESMLRDEEEVFRFIWENRQALDIDERGYTEVISVRPSNRQSPDGFNVRETVCEYVQIAEMFGSELTSVLGIPRPDGMLSNQRVTAYGGGTIVFDQYGRIKYHIQRRLDDARRQKRRLDFLWSSGTLAQSGAERNQFADIHRMRIEVQEEAT